MSTRLSLPSLRWMMAASLAQLEVRSKSRQTREMSFMGSRVVWGLTRPRRGWLGLGESVSELIMTMALESASGRVVDTPSGGD